MIAQHTNSPSPERQIQLDIYLPSTEQQHQLDVLFEILEMSQQQEIRVFITGGYGLDALYGRLTRDHRDIDLYLYASDENRFKEVLNTLGFYPTGVSVGEIGKKEYKNEEFSDKFTIEYGIMENVFRMIPEATLSDYIPDRPLGLLNDRAVWTPTLKAFEKAIEVNNSPVAKHTEPYRHQDWLDAIIPELEKKFEK